MSHHSFQSIDITGEMQGTLTTNHAGSKWEGGSRVERVFPLQTGAATDAEIAVTLLRHWFEQYYWKASFVDATLDYLYDGGVNSSITTTSSRSIRHPWMFGASLVDVASIASVGITGRHQGETHDGHNIVPPLEGKVWNTFLTVWRQLLRKKYPSLQHVSMEVTFETVCKDQVMRAHAPWCGWSTADIVKSLTQPNSDDDEDIGPMPTTTHGNANSKPLRRKSISPRKQLELNVISLQNTLAPPSASNTTITTNTSFPPFRTKEVLDKVTVDGIQWKAQPTTMDDVTYLQGGGYLYHPRVGPIRKNLKKIEKIGSDYELRARNIVNTPVKMALVNQQMGGREKRTEQDVAVCVSGPMPPYLHQTAKRLKQFVLSTFNIPPRVYLVTNEDGHEYFAEKNTSPKPTTSATEGETETIINFETNATEDTNYSSSIPSTTSTVQQPSPPPSPTATTMATSISSNVRASADHIVFAEKLRMINHLLKSPNGESRILLLGDSQRWNSEIGGWVPVFPHACLVCVRWMLREGCHASIVSQQVDTPSTHPKYILLTRTDTSFEAPVYFDLSPARVHLGGYCRSAASHDPHFPTTPYHVGCSQLLGRPDASRGILLGDVGTAIRDLHQVQDAVIFGHAEEIAHIMCMFSLILSNGGLGEGKSSWVKNPQLETPTAKLNAVLTTEAEEGKESVEESTTTHPPLSQGGDPSQASSYYDADTHAFGRYIQTFLRPFYRIVHELSLGESTPLTIGIFPFPITRQLPSSTTQEDISQRPDAKLDRRRYDNQSMCFTFTFHRKSNVTATPSHVTHSLSKRHRHLHLQHGDLGYVTFTPLASGSCFNGVDGYNPWGGVPWCGYQNGSIMRRTSRREWLGKNATCFPFCNFWRVPSLVGVCAAPHKWTPPTLSEDQLVSKFTRYSTPPDGINDLWTPAYFSWTPPRNVEGSEEGSTSRSHHHLDVLDISITDRLKIYQPSSMMP